METPSSISSSSPTRSGRTGLLGACALLLVAELLARLYRPDGTIPYEVGAREYMTLGPELAAFGAREVSVVGDSRSREAILAPMLAAKLARSRVPGVGNYSMSAALAEDTSGIVARLLRADGRPRLIVYGVTPRVLSAAKAKAAPYARLIWHLQDWWQSRRIRGSRVDEYLPETLRNEIADRSRLFRLRPELDDVAHAPFGRHGLAFRLRLMRLETSRYPQSPLRGGLPFWKTLSTRDATIPVSRKEVRDYLGNENREPEWPHTYQEPFLDATVQRCRDAGVPLVFVEIPCAPILRAELPKRTYPGFYEVMSRISHDYAVPFIRVSDLGGDFAQADFREESHLNYRGAQKYTTALAEKLAPLVPGN